MTKPKNRSDHSNEKVSNVKVLVRVRPRIQRELDNESQILVNIPNKTTIVIEPQENISSSTTTKPKEKKVFQFDELLWSCDPQSADFKSQADTYNSIGKEILEHTISGYNTCIFTYGQTGSGKSYTMMGDHTDNELGIIPRACKELFEKIGEFSKLIKTNVKISYFEIYNEQVHDLLDTNEKKKLKVRENPKTGPYVEQLNEFDVNDNKEILKFMKMGNLKRTTASTVKNDQSSRSHAIFTINLRITEYNDNLELIQERNSSLKLVDLAGSEKSTGSQGLRLREGNNINKSLTTLGRVISSLSDTDGGKPPFRDSVLTWLLKENLNGNCKTVMIGCISPCDYEESLSTLRYATLVKKVELKAVKNIDEVNQGVNELKFKEMQSEITKLNQELLNLKENDEMVNKINNMNRFFHDRLLDERNKSSLIMSKLKSCELENEVLKKNLNLLIGDINYDRSTAGLIRDIQTRYTALKQTAVDSNVHFSNEIAQFAP